MMLRFVAALLLLLASAPAAATTVIRATLPELMKSSEVVVHGIVRHVDDQLATDKDGPFQTAVDLELVEVIKGLDAGTRVLRLVLPGGRAFERTLRPSEPGMWLHPMSGS